MIVYSNYSGKKNEMTYAGKMENYCLGQS